LEDPIEKTSDFEKKNMMLMKALRYRRKDSVYKMMGGVYICCVCEKERENLWIFRYWIVGNAVVS
jgi:hypothetical protein